jgi:hypothetical protein
MKKLGIIAPAVLLVAGSSGLVSVQAAAAADVLHPAGGALQDTVRVAPRATVSAGALPDAMDLSAWTVPVGDQGSVGSCVSWAISYGMMGWYSRYQGISSSGIAFAPMYSYSQIHADNSPDGGGTWPSAAYDIGTSQGVDTQADYWQGNYDWVTQPTDAERTNAASYKTGGFSYLYSGTPGIGADNAIKTAVAGHHPVALTIPIYSAFDRLSSTSFHLDASQIDTSTYRGSHEVLVVGYDASGVRIENSWGTGWGDHGFANLNWNFVEQYSTEATDMSGLLQETATAPGAPTGVTGAAVSSSSATLSWSPPASDGGSAVTGYVVSRDGGSAGGTGWSKTVAATARSQTFLNLKAGSTYQLSVAAVNAQGTGPSVSVPVKVSAAKVPGAPVIGTASPGTAGGAVTAKAAWSPPASDGGSAVTGYVVRALRMSSSGTVLGTTTSGVQPASARSLSMTLPSKASYRFTVAAVNAVGAGPQSARSNLVAGR